MSPSQNQALIELIDELLSHLGRDEPLPIPKLARRLPNRPHVATVWRWAQKGIRGVRLETFVLGGRRYTSPALFREFLHRLNEGARPERSLTSAKRSKPREVAAARAALIFPARGSGVQSRNAGQRVEEETGKP